MNFKATAYGYEFQTSYALGFFSFGNVTWQDLPQIYPELSFDRVKQVHGDRTVESRQTVAFEENGLHEEADALFTHIARRAVTVVTADCLPVLILHPEAAIAIHAGWRGVKNEIILKTLQKFGTQFCGHEKAVALIGPHILQKSFEVDKSLADEFQQQFQVYCIASHGPGPAEIVAPHPSRPNEKAFVNLQAIATQQLMLAGFDTTQIHTINLDTMTDARFASYRRDQSKSPGHYAGRNFSFATRY